MTQATTETRAEHLAWAKARAMEYLPHDPAQAFASLGSDLNKHPETENHSGMELGAMLMMAGHLDTPTKMAEFIRGFN